MERRQLTLPPLLRRQRRARDLLHVQPLEELISTKLLALTEQEPDFGGCLEIARSLREQIDWDDVRERTDGAPFAADFFTLVEELGVVEAAP